ncbi:Type IV secretion system protein VirB10 [Candidatus Cyrtobacter comes]|uniref:Type IV secretion system protein VirB10 n=1 Tax=Candidatus Cyrtobacter comes TaxID=675776 RepID=A0ABU5L9D6_9RICK|nr:TrbI/VirB10 family protein [Candidatus Cyrtobacter comes]MDZ5762737.1 Type IV secretion system protein VirB10 [Candidatus Cyrtobacter comes]
MPRDSADDEHATQHNDGDKQADTLHDNTNTQNYVGTEMGDSNYTHKDEANSSSNNLGDNVRSDKHSDTEQWATYDNKNDIKEDSFSSVAVSKKNKTVGILILIAVAIFAVYFIFSEQDQDNDNKETTPNGASNLKAAEKVIMDSSTVAKEIPEFNNYKSFNSNPIPLPEPPPLQELESQPVPIPNKREERNEVRRGELPPPPPLPFAITESTVPTSPSVTNMFSNQEREEEEKRRIEAKRKAGIMVMGSGAGVGLMDSFNDGAKDKDSAKQEKKNDAPGDFLGFGDGALDVQEIAHTSAQQERVTKVGNLRNMILEGKVIDAVLETAINTDIPGSLRAVVTRNVFSEQGQNILIPAGSRLIGEYDAKISAGQARVSIIWNRLILPSGIDIMIASAGTDKLGRAGVRGKLDSKFREKLISAFLVSYVIPTVSNKIINNNEKITQTKDKDGKIITEGSASALLNQETTQKFNGIASNVVEQSFSVKPTITINQGELVNIIVQKDLIFPN